MNRILRTFGVWLVVSLLGVFACTSIRAEPQISVTSFPSTANAGQEFEIGFSAVGLSVGSSYYIKGLGGENFTEVDTWNSGWFQQNAAWVSMPTFDSGSDGSPSATFKVRFDEEAASGTKDFKVRIKKSDSDGPNFDSSIVSISVSALPPTPSATPMRSSSPSLVPTPTATHFLSVLPTKRPTKTPTPSPTIEVRPEVLAEETTGPTPALESTPQNKFPFGALVLIILGIGFVGASCYMAFKDRLR